MSFRECQHWHIMIIHTSCIDASSNHCMTKEFFTPIFHYPKSHYCLLSLDPPSPIVTGTLWSPVATDIDFKIQLWLIHPWVPIVTGIVSKSNCYWHSLFVIQLLLLFKVQLLLAQFKVQLSMAPFVKLELLLVAKVCLLPACILSNPVVTGTCLQNPIVIGTLSSIVTSIFCSVWLSSAYVF